MGIKLKILQPFANETDLIFFLYISWLNRNNQYFGRFREN